MDAAAGELFVSVDNPAPAFYGKLRAGDNLFTDSLVVLDATTARRLWHVQLRKHHTRDYGVSVPAVLMSIRGRSLVAQGAKDGYLYVIDRFSHRVAFSTAVTTVERGDAQPTIGGTRVCPGISGGYLYNSPSFDPHSATLVSGAVGRSTSDVGSGWVTSIDAITGRVRWKVHTAAPVFAAVTSTAGGVTFNRRSWRASPCVTQY